MANAVGVGMLRFLLAILVMGHPMCCDWKLSGDWGGDIT